ncbi:hypothetical protein [Nocardioides cynanchi]|uniref:hypothetical protein n=1 Tax=Nocardioides cynanchi TaxID=2558918 RepID=UPI00124513D6|nr:hypothetical protein [Nocardioides cynanchi]
MLERHSRRPVARSVTLAGLAVLGLLLSGCGGSLGIHPGSAVVVGSDSVSMDKIDTDSGLICQAFLPQLQQGGQKVPMRYVRQLVATNLAQRALGQQLADAYSVQPTPDYANQVTQLTQQFASATPEIQRAVIDVEGGSAYLQNVQVAVGRQLLAASGSPSASTKSAFQRGQVATQDWLRSHSATIDPVFGASVDGGAFTQGYDQTSYPLSTLAAAGFRSTSQSADPAYTTGLPPSQICG